MPFWFISRVSAVRLLALSGLLGVECLAASSPGAERILLVVNSASAASVRLGRFYQEWHGLPEAQVCRIRTADASSRASETISRSAYDKEIAGPIGACLERRGLREQVWYLVLTQGIPIRIAGAPVADWRRTEQASVDSELTLLYRQVRGEGLALAGPVPNPMYRQRDVPLTHARFPLYLVTRLAGYSFEDARKAVERCRAARNEGAAVLDLKANDHKEGNDWLRNAAILLPAERTVLESSTKVATGISRVIAYAGWGSNDPSRNSRKSGMGWLPGAIAAEYVSTSARTFTMPPYDWSLGSWKNPFSYFAGSPQSMILDYVWEGVSGISGATDEPYLGMLPRPDVLIPAYLSGRNLAESFYLAQPVLSWQVMILGDPLCRLQ